MWDGDAIVATQPRTRQLAMPNQQFPKQHSSATCSAPPGINGLGCPGDDFQQHLPRQGPHPDLARSTFRVLRRRNEDLTRHVVERRGPAAVHRGRPPAAQLPGKGASAAGRQNAAAAGAGVGWWVGGSWRELGDAA